MAHYTKLKYAGFQVRPPAARYLSGSVQSEAVFNHPLTAPKAGKKGVSAAAAAALLPPLELLLPPLELL
jgi:hypothetical protein